MADDPTFGRVPEGAAGFKVQRCTGKKVGEDGKKKSTWDTLFVMANGVSVRTFPMAQLSVDNIRAAFGPGQYRVQWELEGRPGGGTSRTFTIGDKPEPVADPAPAIAAAPPPPAASGTSILELAQVFAMFQETFAAPARESARQQIDADRAHTRALIDALNAGAASRPQAAALPPEIAQLLQQQAQAIADLQERLDDEDDEPEDDDEPSAEKELARLQALAVREGGPQAIGMILTKLQEWLLAPAPAPTTNGAPAAAQVQK